MAPRRLKRSLSLLAGSELVDRFHDYLERSTLHILDDGQTTIVPRESNRASGGPVTLGDACHKTFNLGLILSRVDRSRRAGLLEILVDPCPTRALERAGALNWTKHPACGRLVALRSESDGNCLNHAASLAIFGIHDRRLLLRAAVRSFLVDTREQSIVRAIRRDWEHELSRHGVELDPEALNSEWEELKRQSSLEYAATMGDRRTYAYLESTHIYILAHVVRRPIIVLATDWTDSQGRQLAAAEEIAGVYIPFELPRHFCSRSPIVLCFDSFHFSPLVPVNTSSSTLVPLSIRNGRLLPLPFFKRDGNDYLRAAILKFWLDAEHLPDGTLCARINMSPASDGIEGRLLDRMVNEAMADPTLVGVVPAEEQGPAVCAAAAGSSPVAGHAAEQGQSQFQVQPTMVMPPEQQAVYQPTLVTPPVTMAGGGSGTVAAELVRQRQKQQERDDHSLAMGLQQIVLSEGDRPRKPQAPAPRPVRRVQRPPPPPPPHQRAKSERKLERDVALSLRDAYGVSDGTVKKSSSTRSVLTSWFK